MESLQPPRTDLRAFTCPLCNAYAEQSWSVLQHSELYLSGTTDRGGFKHNPGIPKEYSGMLKTVALEGYFLSKCLHCRQFILWYNENIIHPINSFPVAPSPDLPQEILQDYIEAQKVAYISPRSAAALLRLCLQKLCLHLGGGGKNINDDIAAFVSNGLPVRVQQALDLVRVIGNEAVHPGVMDLRDDIETVGKLFWLINFIVSKMITEPADIDNFYKTIPESKRTEIEKRNNKNK